MFSYEKKKIHADRQGASFIYLGSLSVKCTLDRGCLNATLMIRNLIHVASVRPRVMYLFEGTST